MDRVLNIATATAGAGTTSVLDLGDSLKASGTSPRVLRMDLSLFAEGGGFASVLVEHSSDNSTWTTLWNLSDLSGSDYRYVYTWNRYLRVSWSYTVGTEAEDLGGRFQVRFRVFGMPDWYAARVCRWEHCQNIRPSWFDLDDGFPQEYPEALDAAKSRIEIMLKGKGLDPQKLFTDGHESQPVVIGLEHAGALATLVQIHQDSSFPRGDTWEVEQKALEVAFQQAFSQACASGLVLVDAGGGAAATDEDEAYAEPRLGR